MRIVTSSGAVVTARAGDIICYTPGDHTLATLDDYDHWPVDPEIFKETYRAWDDWDWQPSPPEKRLMALGCKPYYKVAGVWAKELDEATYIKSLEQEKPELVKPGRYVVIGREGEPYSMDRSAFVRRYYRRSQSAVADLWRRILRLFGVEDQ